MIQMADVQNGDVQAQNKIQAKVFLRRFDSAILYGIAGTVLGGVAVSVGYLPATLGSLGTGIAVGTALFIAEWVRGIVE